jgi:hypothetical protein
MRRVFMIERPKQSIDITTAEKFGTFVFIYEHDDRRCSIFSSKEYVSCVIERLKSFKFNPATDFVCITGNLITVTYLVVALIKLYGWFNGLLYHAHENLYVARVIGDTND